MTKETVTGRRAGRRREAVVWIDHEQAVIVEHDVESLPDVEVLTRKPTEGEGAFDARAVDQVVDDERVVVAGPAFARTRFERAYVAVTHRPDRLVDVEPTTAGTFKERC